MRSGPNGVTVLIGGNPETYDAVARVLLPCGYSVRYYTGLDSDKLFETAKEEIQILHSWRTAWKALCAL